MFSNAVDKIETILAYLYALSMIGIVVGGLVIMFAVSFPLGLFILVIGSFFSYFSTLLFYSFIHLLDGRIGRGARTKANVG